MLIGETIHTNFIVFSLTRYGPEPMFNHTRGEHASHYTSDAVGLFLIRTYTMNTIDVELIQNGQIRNTGNIGHTGAQDTNRDKQNKQSTTQKTKNKREQCRSHQTRAALNTCAREG
jgi:hypothetical protein